MRFCIIFTTQQQIYYSTAPPPPQHTQLRKIQPRRLRQKDGAIEPLEKQKASPATHKHVPSWRSYIFTRTHILTDLQHRLYCGMASRSKLGFRLRAGLTILFSSRLDASHSTPQTRINALDCFDYTALHYTASTYLGPERKLKLEPKSHCTSHPHATHTHPPAEPSQGHTRAHTTQSTM